MSGNDFDSLAKMAREAEQLEATSISLAQIVASYQRKLVSEGLGEGDATHLTGIFSSFLLDRVFNGPPEYRDE